MTTPSPDTRIAEKDSAETLRAVMAIVGDRATWYDFDRVHFADSVTGLTVGDIRAALDSIPDQIARAVEAERENCAALADGYYASYNPSTVADAIRARGVKS